MMLKFKNFPIFQILAMVAGCLNVLSTGMQYGWSAISFPILLHKNSPVQLTDSEGSWIAVTLLLGAIVGSAVTTKILDKLGRKNIMLISSVFLFAGWVTIAYAKSFWMLMLGRFLGGLADGPIYCSTPVYFAEISSPHIRGFMNSSISFCTVLGMFIINLLGLYYNLFEIAIIGSIFPILCILSVVWLPKSPYYLIMRNNYGGAKISLKIFQPNKNAEYELNRLALAVKEETRNSGKCLDLITVPSNRRAMYIMMGTRAAQQCSGVLAIAFYINVIFSEAGSESIFLKYGSIIYFGLQVLLLGLSTSIVDKAGRKPLMVISLTGSALALLSVSCFFYVKNVTDIDVEEFDYVPIVSLIFFITCFNLGIFSVPYVLVGELFPTNVKAFAVGFADIYFSVISITVTKFFQITKDSYGLHVPFTVFSICSILGCVFIILFVPETKGKTLEEIQILLKK